MSVLVAGTQVMIEKLTKSCLVTIFNWVYSVGFLETNHNESNSSVEIKSEE